MISDIFTKNLTFICIYQKKEVILHPKSKNEKHHKTIYQYEKDVFNRDACYCEQRRDDE